MPNKISTIQDIYHSDLMQGILLSLNEGNKNNAELRKATGNAAASTISNYIRILKNYNFVEEEGYGFHITRTGKMLAYNLNNAKRAFEVIDKFKDFWATHFIEGIPESLLNNIGDLCNSEIIRDTKSYNNAFTNYFNHLQKAKQIFAVSSLTNLEHINAIIKRLKEDVPVEFVHTNDVSKILTTEEYIEKSNELNKYPNFKSMVSTDDIKIGLTVTDIFLSFGLYKKNGTGYDCSEDLFSSDKKALEWGMRLFQYYKARSTPAPFR